VILTSRSLVRDIIALRPVPRRGFWLGNPHPDTWPLYHRYFGTRTAEELRLKLGDDFRWLTPQYMETTYRHPAGKKLFDARQYKVFHGQPGPLAGGYFFGNDFGTQCDLLISPRHFEEFILPWFRKFTDQARAHGWQVILHSCGSIGRVIPHLIAAGVNCLHPLQARAAGMEAERLARDFQGKVAFLGGIDTQQLLVQGSPAEVRAEVRRLKDVFGPWWIVSPSHEALLPNVPPENVAAMAEAAHAD